MKWYYIPEMDLLYHSQAFVIDDYGNEVRFKWLSLQFHAATRFMVQDH